MASRATKVQIPLPSQFEDFDDYLKARGIYEEVNAAVEKRVLALQLDRTRLEQGFSKSELARQVGTSRTQIDRILDPASKNISMATLNRVARTLGKKVIYELVDI